MNPSLVDFLMIHFLVGWTSHTNIYSVNKIIDEHEHFKNKNKVSHFDNVKRLTPPPREFSKVKSRSVFISHCEEKTPN